MTMGVYQIRNNINNKIYIGSSKNISKRWKEHKRELRLETHHNRYLQRAWNKYGENSFEFTIIEEVLDINKLLEKEQYWMDRTLCYQNDKGYNNAKIAGNCTGVKHTEETKKKMSESSKGFKHSEETKKKISESNKGKIMPPVSEETRKKLSKTRKGRKMSQEFSIKMTMRQLGEKNHASILTNEDVLYIKYLLINSDLTQKQIADHYNVIFQTISNIKRGKSWKHIILENSSIDLNYVTDLYQTIKSKSIRVSGIKLNNNDVANIKKMLKERISQKEISEIYKVDPSTISNIARGITWKDVQVS